MKIFILDKDPVKTAQMLDDFTLDEQIDAVAQVLCNVHYVADVRKNLIENAANCTILPLPKIPLPHKKLYKEFTLWASECCANYLKLVDAGLVCCYEYIFRFHPCGAVDIEFLIQSYRAKELVWGDKIKEIEHELQPVIEWAHEFVPALPKIVEEIDDYATGETTENEEQSPFPLVTPEKYIEYLSSTVREGNLKPIDIYQSYRNYYSAFLHTTKEPTWTRREKPYWIEL